MDRSGPSHVARSAVSTSNNADEYAFHVVWGEFSNPSSGHSDNQSISSSRSSKAQVHAQAPAQAHGQAQGYDSQPVHILHTRRVAAASDKSIDGAADFLQANLVGATVFFDSSSSHNDGNSSGSSAPIRGAKGAKGAKTRAREAADESLGKQSLHGSSTAPLDEEDDVDDDDDAEEEDTPELQFVKAFCNTCTPKEVSSLTVALMRSEGPRIEGLEWFWAKGAKGHGGGRCKPCHYVHAPTGCTNGANCGFCHLPHPRTNPRPSKAKRRHYRLYQTVLAGMLPRSRDRLLAAMGTVAANNPELQSIMTTMTPRLAARRILSL
eukprot:CAMPEP_0170385398 /NCGR_PEP_ID=MMETSP0117_2-20130122/16493_1 /TAXON_ID=400756 /ORGANISM="Durinskia baltica, Strain CSIRO CS-38" /LENGTH=321 /DNA_ID=CAMNT_0010641177 /DNA_START=66 /DNA_END=1031 /DNA_ORIENTATION=+